MIEWAMNPTMEDLVRRMDELLRRAETCSDARGVLGSGLVDARMVLDRMQLLLDREYLKHVQTPCAVAADGRQ